MSDKKNSKDKGERTNTGKRGARKAPLDPLSKVLMGKGVFVNIHKSSQRL